jgi:S1-C subfamily serine protease
MAGSKLPAKPPSPAKPATLVTLLIGALASGGAARAIPGDMSSASPGERRAVQAFCAGEQTSLTRNLCVANQMATIQRLGRKPDLSVASSQQKTEIAQACGDKKAPGERYACQRSWLATAGLPVRNEAGGGSMSLDLAANPQGTQNLFRPQPTTDLPFFSLQKWRRERPAMPPARASAVLSAVALNDKVKDSVYVVTASAHAIELAPRTEHSQGSAVAITDHILLTNCHVVAGRPQIAVSQDGVGDRAKLIYGDPAGDRCFLEVDGMMLRPVQGVRRADDLKVGETVYCVGTPAGLERSFGQGLITGLRQWEGVRIVQNSAPSWFGSSGGGLFDERGNLVGITTAIAANMPNTAFSIAAEDFWP